jgi:hypothetical protein
MTRLPGHGMARCRIVGQSPSIHLLAHASEVGGPDLAKCGTVSLGMDMIF